MITKAPTLKPSEILRRAAGRREADLWVKAIDYSPATEDEREVCFRYLQKVAPSKDIGRWLASATKAEVVGALCLAARNAAEEGQ